MPKKITHKLEKDIASAIDEYINTLSETISVQSVFLFGSTARGTRKKDSDIDLMILSPNFSRMNFMKRLQLLSRARTGKATEVAMDIFGYTPEEFAQMDTVDSPVLKQIKKEGYFLTRS